MWGTLFDSYSYNIGLFKLGTLPIVTIGNTKYYRGTLNGPYSIEAVFSSI